MKPAESKELRRATSSIISQTESLAITNFSFGREIRKEALRRGEVIQHELTNALALCGPLVGDLGLRIDTILRHEIGKQGLR